MRPGAEPNLSTRIGCIVILRAGVSLSLRSVAATTAVVDSICSVRPSEQMMAVIVATTGNRNLEVAATSSRR